MRLDGRRVRARAVQDSYKASYGIEFPEGMISVLAQSAMRKEVGNLELDQLFLERERNNVAAALDEASQPWGIRVFRYEIADIAVDKSIREAMGASRTPSACAARRCSSRRATASASSTSRRATASPRSTKRRARPRPCG